MAPRGNLAFLKSMLKGGEAAAGEHRDTPAPDLENVERVQPLTQVHDQGVGDQGGVDARPLRTPHATITHVVDSETAPPADLISKKRKAENVEAGKSKKDKKDKSSKSKHRSDPVPVDADFWAKNVEEYQSDPFGAAARLFSRVAEVKKFEMDEFKKKTEAELIEANSKLDQTRQLYNKKGAQLNLVRNELSQMTTARDGYKTRAEQAETKVQELEAKILELGNSEKQLSEEVERLRIRVRELEEQAKNQPMGETSGEPTAEIADLRRRLAKAQEDGARAAALTMEMATEGFNSAIAQLEVAYPDLQIDPSLVQIDHEVEDGKIIFVHPDSHEKTVVFPREEM